MPRRGSSKSEQEEGALHAEKREQNEASQEGPERPSERVGDGERAGRTARKADLFPESGSKKGEERAGEQTDRQDQPEREQEGDS